MSDDLRIAVLGVGMMGAFHADALSKRIRGARVTVVNDFLDDKAAEVADKVGARTEADPFAAINDPDVDAVLIASPGDAHAAQLTACLDRGIPVPPLRACRRKRRSAGSSSRSDSCGASTLNTRPYGS